MENYFAVGDFIHVNDEDLGINRYSRVIVFKRNILRPYVYELNIADGVKKDRAVKILQDIKRIDNKIK
jgi:hypothetical protein